MSDAELLAELHALNPQRPEEVKRMLHAVDQGEALEEVSQWLNDLEERTRRLR